MGLAFLPIFLVFLYYHLGWSLLGKSIALMSSGLLLLGFRKLYLHQFPPDPAMPEGASHG